MNKEQVELKICEIIGRLAPMPGNGIELSENLRNSYGVDSLVLVELLVEIEEAFDIVFDSSYLTGEFFSTAGTIAAYVSQKLEAA